MLKTRVNEQDVDIQIEYLDGFPEPGTYLDYYAIQVDITPWETNEELAHLKKIFMDQLPNFEFQLIDKGFKFKYKYKELYDICIFNCHSIEKDIEEVVTKVQEKLSGIEIPYEIEIGIIVLNLYC